VSDWRDWDKAPGRPLPVENGLAARSTRGDIGSTWWSRRFIEVMESFALGGRLTRGRAYARKGQVISLDVAPGTVTAEVQGSRVTPYRVRIGLPTFSELTWAKAEVALAEQAVFAAQLLADQFPPELEAVFASLRAPLFPDRLADLKLSCSCPDHAVPCKHLAATFYLLAERFDDDPFLILRWRGRERERLLARLGELRGDLLEPAEPSESDPEPFIGDDESPVLGAALALLPVPSTGGATHPVGLDPAPPKGPDAAIGSPALALTFWTAGRLPEPPARPELPVDLLLRLLPTPPPGLGGQRLITHLNPLYERLASPGE
jgi:uncharacterized Zn finger protein